MALNRQAVFDILQFLHCYIILDFHLNRAANSNHPGERPPMIGKTLAHYEILEKIGAGGMGEVYRARDPQLNREVAIKIVPGTVAGDPEKLARFKREAKTLAAVNHPGIATVFGLHEQDGTQFMAMELVPGSDLSQKISRRALSTRNALAFALQIAEALELAHGQGIIHRDLKPQNLMVTPEGKIKVLDFGLARVVARGPINADDDTSPTITAALTRPGTVMGTPAYMSPEQVRGDDVDARSDIWAFGAVLYEMLTGKNAFGGKNVTETMYKVMATEPDLDLLPASLPAGVLQLVRRCLVKEARSRLQSIGDARIFIQECLDDPSPAEEERAQHSVWRFVPWILVTLLAVGAITRPWTGRQEPRNLLSGATFTRITDFAGSETSAAISRDGKTIACLSDRGGQFDIWVIPVGTGQPYNLTNGLEAGLNSMLRSVGFSPDGSEVWLSGTMDQRMRRMPLIGGTPRSWLAPQVGNVSWSPDGSRIVYTTWEAGDPLIVADRDGSDGREILNSGKGYHQHYPTWGADGWIYLVRGQENILEMDLWRIRPDGTGSERLTTGTLYAAHPTPIDEKTLLFIGQEQNGAGPWLWTLDLESRVARRLSFGLEQYTSLSASADGRSLVASIANPRVGLWQVPISDELADESDASPFELPNLRALAPRFGPGDLYYLSSRGSGDGLWLFRDGTSREIWKGTEAPLLEPVAVSSDGASLVLILRQNEQNVLHVLSADGAQLRALTTAVDVRGSAAWSPDGAWIVAGGEDLDGRPGLFKVSVDGDLVEKIVEGQALNPVWSPAGKLIVYAGQQVGPVGPVLGVRPDGTPVELPPLEVLLRGQRVRFLPDGRGLVHMKTSTNFHQEFWLLDLSTMQDRQLTRLEDAGTLRTFDITPDGTRIVFDRLRDNADIVLIDLADD
jgi:serine/threonine protein kinase